MKNKQKKHLLGLAPGKTWCLWFFMLFSFLAKGQNSQTLSGNSIVPNTTLTTTDALYPAFNNVRFQKVRNYVALQINSSLTSYNDYIATVTLEIEYYNKNGVLQTVSPSPVLTVEHNNNPGVVHQDRGVFFFSNGYDVTQCYR